MDAVPVRANVVDSAAVRTRSPVPAAGRAAVKVAGVAAAVDGGRA